MLARFWTAVLLALLALLALPTRAVETNFQFRNWQTQEGLPSNKIMAVVQTRDGYIWIATYEGLIRFDGVRFTLFDSAEVKDWHDSSVTSLYAARDGTLWIGHANGSVSTCKDGVIATLPFRADWKGNKIQCLGADRAGDVWALDFSGRLARVRDGLALQPAIGPAAGLAELTSSAEGRIWLTRGGALSELKDGRLEVVPLRPEMQDYVQGVCASRDGGLWVVSQGHLWKHAAGRWSEDFGELSIGATPLHAFTETSDGRLVAGTSDLGALIITVRPRLIEQRLRRSTGFASDWVTSACEDHEGGLWLASGTAGLFHLRAKKVSMLVPSDEWQGRSVLTVSPAQGGGLWVGTEGAGLYRLTGGEWTNYGTEAGLRNRYVWSVVEDRAGALWVGTWVGLHTRIGERYSPPPGSEEFSSPTRALLPARGGGIWVGCRLGLIHFENGIERWVEPSADRRLLDVSAIAEAPDGTLWVGCNGYGLGEVRDGIVRQYRTGAGLSSDYILSLHLDQSGALWIGTRGGGLRRFKDGRFTAVTTAQGLANGSICHIEEDGLGYFWMSSHGGIMRVSERELNACADGELPQVNCLSYGLSDGLLTLACPGALQPAGCRLPDGRLVFATDRGLAVIDPRDVTLNAHAPPVSIESVRAGERMIAENSFPVEALVVQPGENRIEIKYAGLSFAAPEKVKFKHRLEGLEADWVPVGNERLAVYNYVPPGRYVFRVTAANNDNVWNPEGRSLAVVVLPYFWQTLWFRLLVLTALLLGAGALVWFEAHRRLQRTLDRLERERAIQAERTRIANDMHDDLGAHLTRITMLSETARGDLADPARVEDGLRQIYETARGVTRAMDEIVWAVNPKHDTLESLVYYFEKFAQDLLGAAGIRCRLDLPVEFPPWNPSSEVRHNLFLAYKEALNNAARHSAADTVTVALEVVGAGCRLTVSDNGRGFAPAGSGSALPAGSERVTAGNGLPSMRDRLRRMGGSCEIRSEPGKGCVVTLFIPVTFPAQPASADS